MSKILMLMVGGDIIGAALIHYLGIQFIYASSLNYEDDLFFVFVRVSVFAFVLVLITYLVELYDARRPMNKKFVPVRILISLVLSFGALSAIYSLMPQLMLNPGVMVVVLATFGCLQLLWHLYCPLFMKFFGMTQRILILGVGPMAQKIEKSMAASQHSYVLAGYVQPADEVATVPPVQILAPLEGLLDAAVRGKVEKIVVSLSERRGVLPVNELLQARFRGIEIVDAASFYEELTGTLLVKNINPGWFIYSGGFCSGTFQQSIKRLNDFVLSLIGIVLISPLLPLIAIAIKLDSPGDILYRQVRLGKEEREFTLYKFRTMRQDAERSTGAVWSQRNDQRITRIGRFLRKSRLDEIPQLLNVLKGDMALVGPRPERPEFVEKLKEEIPYYSKRHTLKPGVTGWAQVKYSYGASVEDSHEKLKYDLYYIKHYSLLLDFVIVLETIKVVAFGRGGR
jgi:sugar transferase (PEP-CTERM system associated)